VTPAPAAAPAGTVAFKRSTVELQAQLTLLQQKQHETSAEGHRALPARRLGKAGPPSPVSGHARCFPALCGAQEDASLAAASRPRAGLTLLRSPPALPPSAPTCSALRSGFRTRLSTHALAFFFPPSIFAFVAASRPEQQEAYQLRRAACVTREALRRRAGHSSS